MGFGLQLADRLLGITQPIEQMAAVLRVQGPSIGQPNLPCGAVE